MPQHMHGADHFARHLEVVEAARAGDRIFFTDWPVDSDERLTDAGPTIGELPPRSCCGLSRPTNVAIG